MKILFFVPTVIQSSIGRGQSLVVEQLITQGHDVVVVRAEDLNFFDDSTHPFRNRIICWNNTNEVRQAAEQSDLVIYHIGDNFQYHRGCLEWMTTLPGVVIIHDNFLGNLFWGWSERIGRQTASTFLAKLYGAEVAHRFFDHADSASFISYASQAAPMTEWMVGLASAVIVHSSWSMDKVRPGCPVPIKVAHLPYDAPYLGNLELVKQGSPNGHVNVLTVGHVNQNKRSAEVIKAIGASAALRGSICYRIVGSVDTAMRRDLTFLADSLGVHIVITGSVDDITLATEILNADIMCCLRLPALEGASGSTIEAMLYGKPTIVTNTGFYRDLPDDCVIKVSPESEMADIQEALVRLVTSPSERIALGSLARSYASQTFRADLYAECVVDMKQRIDRSKLIADTALIFSERLKQWGMRGDHAIAQATAAPLALFR